MAAELRPYRASLIAVSKTQPAEAILRCHAEGQRDFGENKVRELVEKQSALPADIRWHFIGHLQTNKVKYIAPFVTLVHSVDSLRLLREIDRQAARCGRTIDCLLQFHIAREETKYGLSRAEAAEMLDDPIFRTLRHVRLVGVMGMASFTHDTAQIRSEFRTLRETFDFLKERFFPKDEAFRELSMGMSGDYRIALEEGSTLVRIGSLLFGERS
ncbi:MAG: hypothetical protein RLY31_387 [Bacteroidota bacterium]